MSGIVKINGIGPITDGANSQGLAQTIPLLIEVRTGSGVNVLEISQAAAQELKDGLTSSLRARGFA